MLNNPLSSRPVSRWVTVLAVAGVLGCGGGSTDPAPPPPPPPPPPAPISPTVTSASPYLAHPGDVALQVTISGTNFVAGATVRFERNGVAEPKLQVASAQVTNSSTIVATISAGADGPVGFYDVAVTNSGNLKGTGPSLFELTEGTSIADTRYALAVNEAGTVVGEYEPEHFGFVWTKAGGKTNLSTELGNIDTNGGRAIDEAGTTIVGVSGNNAVVWTGLGNNWIRSSLPMDPAAGYALAWAVGSDPVTGRATVIGGAEGYGRDGVTPDEAAESIRRPRAWVVAGADWQRVILPTPVGELLGMARVASASGRVAGYVRVSGGRRGAIWTPNGVGGWALTVLEPNSIVGGINSAGDFAAGTVNDQPAYWKRTGATWSAATLIPSASCSGIVGVDDSGRILGNPCRPGGFRWVPVVWVPPYDAASIRSFGGIGDPNMGGHPKAISIRGTWVVGGAAVPGIEGFVGTYWRAF